MQKWKGRNQSNKLSIFERFIEKVKISSACWEWQAGKNQDGYGRLALPGKGSGAIQAHRFSYEYYIGYLEPEFAIGAIILVASLHSIYSREQKKIIPKTQSLNVEGHIQNTEFIQGMQMGVDVNCALK